MASQAERTGQEKHAPPEGSWPRWNEGGRSRRRTNARSSRGAANGREQQPSGSRRDEGEAAGGQDGTESVVSWPRSTRSQDLRAHWAGYRREQIRLTRGAAGAAEEDQDVAHRRLLLNGAEEELEGSPSEFDSSDEEEERDYPWPAATRAAAPAHEGEGDGEGEGEDAGLSRHAYVRQMAAALLSLERTEGPAPDASSAWEPPPAEDAATAGAERRTRPTPLERLPPPAPRPMADPKRSVSGLLCAESVVCACNGMTQGCCLP
jgi:hypothetical protein